MAELADAPDLGSGVYDVQVQVLSSAGDGWSGSDFRKEIGFGSFFCVIGNYSVMFLLHKIRSARMRPDA